MIVLYQFSSFFIMAWSFLHLVGKQSGIVGKSLHFLVTLEAGAICFPASSSAVPQAESLVFCLVLAVFYNDFRRKAFSA